MSNRIVRTTVYLPNTLHSKLKEDAFYSGKSFNQLILEKLAKSESKKSFFKVKAFDIGVSKKLGRGDIYAEILKHRG